MALLDLTSVSHQNKIHQLDARANFLGLDLKKNTLSQILIDQYQKKSCKENVTSIKTDIKEILLREDPLQ